MCGIKFNEFKQAGWVKQYYVTLNAKLTKHFVLKK